MAGIANLFARIGAKTDDFKKGVKDVKDEGKDLQSYFGKVGGVIAGAFAAEKVIDFAKECTQLAMVAEGVQQAFNRIGDETMLEGLRRATKGTVSDLELMKAAVQAKNFGIPLQNLGSLLEFAHQRAKDTGQSVDYLVQSIVLGIGRKSPLILDNLGISAVQLREKFKGLSAEQQTVADVAKAVGEIATDAMKGIGDSAETAAEKSARLSAEWANMKTSIGSLINSALNPLRDGLIELFKITKDVFSDKAAKEAGENMASFIKSVGYESLSSADKAKILGEQIDIQNQYYQEQSQKLNELIAYKKSLGILQLGEKSKTKDQIDWLTKHISAQDIFIKQLKDMRKNIAEEVPPGAGVATPETIGLIEAAEKKVKDLQDAYNKAPTAGLAAKISNEVIQAQKDLEALKLQISNLANPRGEKAPDVAKITPISSKIGSIPLPTAEEMAAKLNPATESYQGFADNMQAINDSINQGMSDFVSGFAEHLGAVAVGVESIGQLGEALLGMVADFMGSLGKQLIALGTAGIAAQILGKNPYTALAAGIALVALSGAAKAAMGGGPFGGGGGGGGQVASSTYGNLKGENDLTVQIEGVVKGSDIYFTQKNYNKKMNNNIVR